MCHTPLTCVRMWQQSRPKKVIKINGWKKPIKKKRLDSFPNQGPQVGGSAAGENPWAPSTNMEEGGCYVSDQRRARAFELTLPSKLATFILRSGPWISYLHFYYSPCIPGPTFCYSLWELGGPSIYSPYSDSCRSWDVVVGKQGINTAEKASVFVDSQVNKRARWF